MYFIVLTFKKKVWTKKKSKMAAKKSKKAASESVSAGNSYLPIITLFLNNF